MSGSLAFHDKHPRDFVLRLEDPTQDLIPQDRKYAAEGNRAQHSIRPITQPVSWSYFVRNITSNDCHSPAKTLLDAGRRR